MWRHIEGSTMLNGINLILTEHASSDLTYDYPAYAPVDPVATAFLPS